MSVETVIQNADQPRTVTSLSADLRALGLREGMVVLAHSSLSSLGWVVGGAQSAILALTQTLGEAGTLVMPAYCTDNTDPRDWREPPIPEAWWQSVRDDMPAFDPHQTPTREMGKIAETFRSWPGARRSTHPATSFCAWGRLAEVITRDHGLEYGFGENSPLARLYEAHGHVLLLGVGHAVTRRCIWPSSAVTGRASGLSSKARPCWSTGSGPGSASMNCGQSPRISARSGRRLTPLACRRPEQLGALRPS